MTHLQKPGMCSQHHRQVLRRVGPADPEQVGPVVGSSGGGNWWRQEEIGDPMGDDLDAVTGQVPGFGEVVPRVERWDDHASAVTDQIWQGMAKDVRLQGVMTGKKQRRQVVDGHHLVGVANRQFKGGTGKQYLIPAEGAAGS